MEFGILGPTRVVGQYDEIRIGGAKPRALLAMLLFWRNRLVSMSQLIDSLWEEDTSLPGARSAVQGHIKRLRQMLGRDVAGPLETRPSGYQLSVDEDELDLSTFQTLVRLGRSAAADARWDEAADNFTNALALWRGDPLQDVTQSSYLRNEAERLTELRLQAIEWRVDADMHTGRCAELVSELRQLTAAYPLQERFHGQLMVALYRCGRQAEALTAFQVARAGLAQDLGVEPGPQPQGLYRWILSDDQTPDASAAATGPIGSLAGRGTGPVRLSPRPGPSQLPADISDSTGRGEEVAALLTILGDPRSRPTTITGAGGMGKTALINGSICPNASCRSTER